MEESTDTKKVEYKFIDGHFYCDGIKVLPSQMTREEVMKYVPKAYREAFLKHSTQPLIEEKR